MEQVPRLNSRPQSDGPTCGDVYRLNLDLYEYAGDCRSRLNAVISNADKNRK